MGGLSMGGLSAQWAGWMASRGLAAVRAAVERLPSDEGLFGMLAGLLLHVGDDAVDSLPEPRIRCPQMLPALFA
eukprot:6171180-Prymnesium_polylepis.1